MPKMEYKTAPVTGVSKVVDLGEGVVNAIVSITGVEDKVGDIIIPGAYEESLADQFPKGAWSHKWEQPVSRTLDAIELMPGDPRLPKWLNEKKQIPWPAEAGALSITAEFNLGTQRGRDAYSDVVFFGPDQEWSIGYQVDPSKTEKKGGKRYIGRLSCKEYSPVLFGAMPNTRTSSVKDAQMAFKTLNGESTDEWEAAYTEYKSTADIPDSVSELTGYEFAGDPEDVDEIDEVDLEEDGFDANQLDDDADEILDGDEDYEDEVLEKRAPRNLNKDLSAEGVRLAIKALTGVLEGMGESVDELVLGEDSNEADAQTAFIEAKATGYDSVTDAVDDLSVSLSQSDMRTLQSDAAAFDAAYRNQDAKAADSAADSLMDILEAAISSGGDDNGGDSDSARAVSQLIGDKLAELHGMNDSDQDGDAGSDESDDSEAEEKSVYYSKEGIEYKSAPTYGRLFGVPSGRVPLEAKDRQRAFVGCLTTDALIGLGGYVQEVKGNNALKTMVYAELDSRQRIEGKAFKTPAYMRASGRARGAVKGTAMPDGSFPIENKQQLSDAIDDAPRAKDPVAARKFIMKRAKALKLADMIPDTWNPDGSTSGGDTKGLRTVIESKSLDELAEFESFAAQLTE